ncbi:4703_t:CDS:2 [Paraglomus brasilianum]|uniref:4703_t:CDS:1 n=1 Tax=Paraglomus brasilianum TaxID=144538 RepID=A0A9N9B7I1_9GLOM|nr:4703_t:CDS:2 [Paraglomus brasilianum]
MSQIKQRNLISALQKREICLLKKDISKPKNADLARQFGISPGQVTDILKESVKWLAIDPNSYQAKLKKARPSTVTNIEEQENIQHLINSLSVDAPLTATEYITVDDKDANDEMVTDDEIISLFLPAEEEEDNDGEIAQCPLF